MTDRPKAIPTIYQGCRFRSRLEARWAVFFDTLGLRWEYEAEGYDIDGLWYLPDFWLPDLKCWIEIKGVDFQRDDDTWIKARGLAGISGHCVYVIVGQIRSHFETSAWAFFGYEDDETGFGPTECWWLRCPACHVYQLGYCVDELPCLCFEGGQADATAELRRALDAARQADFRRGGTV